MKILAVLIGIYEYVKKLGRDFTNMTGTGAGTAPGF